MVSAMSTLSATERASFVRAFNRFYTRQVGALQEHLLDSEFSLTEARILYELANQESLTSTDLCRALDLNAGYLSRVISGFEAKGLVEKSRSALDARAFQLTLTNQGKAVFAPLNEASLNTVLGMLEHLTAPQQHQLIEAMRQIQSLLGERETSYLLRDPQPGDLGWVVHQQAVLYAREYGWNSEFEALVAEIVATYIRNFNPTSDRCWIAEKDGKVVGSIFVVRHDETTAKLRMLYVDASARGMGIGRRLVEEAMRFARLAGYTRMVLWTNDALLDARKLYQRAGFELVEEVSSHSFGMSQIEQTWARDL